MLAAVRKKILNFMLRRASRANYKFVLKDWQGLFDLSLSSHVLETKRFTRNLAPVLMERPQA